MKKIFSFILILVFVFSFSGTAFADYIEIEEGSRGCVTSVLDSVGNVTEKVCDSLFGRPTRRRIVRTIPPYAFERCPASIPEGYVLTPYGYAVPVERVRQPQVIEQNVIIQNDSNNEQVQSQQVQVPQQKPQVVNKTYKNYNKVYRTYKQPNTGYCKTTY